nr:phage tail terminator-like protein [Syntrophales bacterium]
YVMPATPDNPTLGDGFYREQGVFQVSLFYPLLAGPQTAEARAQLIRTTFKRGTAMTSGAVKVVVDRTPEIGQGRVDGDRWHIPVKIRFSAGIIA